MSAEARERGSVEALLAEVERLRDSEERAWAENEHLIETHQAFEETRDAYIDLFEFVPLACLVLDSDGAIEKLNAAAIHLLAHERPHLVGAFFHTLLIPLDRRRFLDHLRECRESRGRVSCEVSVLRRGGDPFPVHVTSQPARASAGFLTALVDLREREAAALERQRLATAERDARAVNVAKDQFIAMLSHELRTPLTPVLAAASALVDYEELPADMRSTLAIVQRNVARQAQLIDDLLDVARINHGKLRIENDPVDVHRTLRDALETLTGQIDGHDLALSTDLTAQQTWVNGDSMRLQQVFWNLLRNSIKFTPSGGQIAIRSWNSPRRVYIEISDNGRGIAADSLTRLFEPFEQVLDAGAGSLRGLGLGLPICRGIVEQHHGRIDATSEGLGKGSRFVVELGTIDAPAILEAPPPSVRPNTPASKLRILLVEDDEDTAEIFERFLLREGHEVQVAHSVRAALAVDRETFDFLLSDVGLGDGSGHDLMRALRKEREVRGVALSGYGTEDDIRASKQAGFDAHVTKPVNFGTLVEVIASLRAH